MFILYFFYALAFSSEQINKVNIKIFVIVTDILLNITLYNYILDHLS